MDDAEVARMWQDNAPEWTRLSRAGYNLYRDLVNSPAFFRMLPDVRDLAGLDLGCGEGHDTRLAAERGARMTGLDISRSFIESALAEEKARPLGIRYVAAGASKMPFSDASFDFVMAMMSLMDMPSPLEALAEIRRVLVPGGFVQFAISHPCFMTPRFRPLFDDKDEKVAVACGDYFSCPQGVIAQWTFGAVPDDVRRAAKPFRIPQFFRTLSNWLNMFIEAEFVLERMEEPCADQETAARHPDVADTRLWAYFLHARFRKPYAES